MPVPTGTVQVDYKPKWVDVPSNQFFCPKCSRLCWVHMVSFRTPAEAGFYKRYYGALPTGKVYCQNGCSERWYNWAPKDVNDRDVPIHLFQKLRAEMQALVKMRND